VLGIPTITAIHPAIRLLLHTVFTNSAQIKLLQFRLMEASSVKKLDWNSWLPQEYNAAIPQERDSMLLSIKQGLVDALSTYDVFHGASYWTKQLSM